MCRPLVRRSPSSARATEAVRTAHRGAKGSLLFDRQGKRYTTSEQWAALRRAREEQVPALVQERARDARPSASRQACSPWGGSASACSFQSRDAAMEKSNNRRGTWRIGRDRSRLGLVATRFQHVFFGPNTKWVLDY